MQNMEVDMETQQLSRIDLSHIQAKENSSMPTRFAVNFAKVLLGRFAAVDPASWVTTLLPLQISNILRFLLRADSSLLWGWNNLP